MESFYSVTRSGNACGKVAVSRRGLYYCFHCRCVLNRDDIYRLILSDGERDESLGILVPIDGSFELTTKIPVRNLAEGEWTFRVVPKNKETAGCFVPIKPEEPFAYISRLKESFLVSQNGEPGIRIEKLQE